MSASLLDLQTMTSQQFNLSRFSLLLKLYWAEHGKSYLISLGLIVGIMASLMAAIVGTSQYNDLLFILHAVAMFGGVMLGGSLFTSTAFAAYASADKGIAAIMLPASQIEKFVSILLPTLLFAVVVFAVGYGLHYGLVDLANDGLLSTSKKYQPAPPFVMHFFAFSYLLLQGAVFLGSLYFTKNAFIKTLGIVLLITSLAFVFNLFLAYQFTGQPRSVMAFPFLPWDVFLDQRYQVQYPASVSNLIKMFLSLVTVAFGYITYVRLKEKEI